MPDGVVLKNWQEMAQKNVAEKLPSTVRWTHLDKWTQLDKGSVVCARINPTAQYRQLFDARTMR
jgi:hypothetical protein